MDMIPLNREWFWKQDMIKLMHLDYANVYGHTYYPLCYVGGDALSWKEIMRPSHLNDIRESIHSQFIADNLIEETDGLAVCCYDELLFGRKIKAWDGYPDDCQMFNRRGGPPVDRIDRSCWPSNLTIKGKVDCHSVRPAHTSPNWEKVLSVLVKILDKKDIKRMEEYRNSFCEKE